MQCESLTLPLNIHNLSKIEFYYLLFITNYDYFPFFSLKPTIQFATTTQGTTEQEDYVKGFVDALNSLHKKDSQNTMSTVATTTVNSVVTGNGMSGGSITYTNLGKYDTAFNIFFLLCCSICLLSNLFAHWLRSWVLLILDGLLGFYALSSKLYYNRYSSSIIRLFGDS